MVRCTCAATFAFLSILRFATSAQAETLRCQSVNGNVNCAGSDGVACQTINGKKTCVSGHGDVVQSFGKGNSSNSSSQDFDEGAVADDEALDDPSSANGRHKHQQQRALTPHDNDSPKQ
jgi:hypothetical protein